MRVLTPRLASSGSSLAAAAPKQNREPHRLRSCRVEALEQGALTVTCVHRAAVCLQPAAGDEHHRAAPEPGDRCARFGGRGRHPIVHDESSADEAERLLTMRRRLQRVERALRSDGEGDTDGQRRGRRCDGGLGERRATPVAGRARPPPRPSRAKTNPSRAKAPSTTSRSHGEREPPRRREALRSGPPRRRRRSRRRRPSVLMADDHLLRRTIGLHRAVELEMVRPEARHDGDVRARRHEREVGARELEHDHVRSVKAERARRARPSPTGGRGGRSRWRGRATGGSKNLNGERRSGRLPRRARAPTCARPPARARSSTSSDEQVIEGARGAEPGHALRRFGVHTSR